jgi:hypothetical protein
MQHRIDASNYRGVGRLLTRRETLLAAGSTGVGAASLGLTAMDICPEKLFLVAMPTVYAGTFWLDMDSQAADTPEPLTPGRHRVELKVSVKELLSDRLLPLSRAAIHYSTPVGSLLNLRQTGWRATDKNGDVTLTWEMETLSDKIKIPLIIAVRHYNPYSDLTSVFETAILFTNGLESEVNRVACCAVPAARAVCHTSNTVQCAANIVLVNRETRIQGGHGLR